MHHRGTALTDFHTPGSVFRRVAGCNNGHGMRDIGDVIEHHLERVNPVKIKRQGAFEH